MRQPAGLVGNHVYVYRRDLRLRRGRIWTCATCVLISFSGLLGAFPFETTATADEDAAAAAARRRESILERQKAILADEQKSQTAKQPGAGDEQKRHEAGTRAEKCELLDMLADKSLANYEQIVTWVGDYTIADVYLVTDEAMTLMRLDKPPGTGPWTRQDRGTVGFKWDSGRDSVFTSIEMIDCRVIRDANDLSINLELPLTSPQRSIVSPTQYFSFVPTDNWPDFKEVPGRKGMHGRVAFRDSIEKAEEARYSTVVDPRNFFRYARFFWDECRFFSTQIKGNTLMADQFDKAVRVLSFDEDDDKTYLIQLTFAARLDDASSTRVGEFRISSKNGFNFTSVTTADSSGKLFETINWDWIKDEGVFIPKMIVRKTFQHDSGALAMMRLLEMHKSDLNKPINPAAFEIASLGLTNGERVVDRVEQVCYLYEDGKMVDPVRFNEIVAEVKSTISSAEGKATTGLVLLVAVNATVVALLLGWWSWKRRTRSRGMSFDRRLKT